MSNKIAITPVALREPQNPIAVTLRERGFTVAQHPEMTPPSPEEQRALLDGAIGFIAGPEPVGREALAAAGSLRVVSRFGVGYDNIDLQAATDLGIIVTYVPDAMVEAVADLTLGLLITAARRISELDAAAKRGDWVRVIAADVSGATLGLVGTGRIGLAVARRAKAFGMRLLGCDPYPNRTFTEELGGRYVPLEELAAGSDFLSLHMPATSETRNLIGPELLARMRPTAFLVNAARGSVVDEPALLVALDEGRLAGAALDVFSVEPPAPDSAAARLMRHPRVVATPHVASFTPATVARMGQCALENLLTVLDGRRPEHVANPEVYERGLRFGA
ncbi:MAG: phosphoglycerate dehydrogenase [Armatimonadota bacterium]